MDKTNRTEFSRTFLIEGLPAPLTRASAHIQIFDNYILETRLRLRSVRIPETSVWTRLLQQRFPANGGNRSALKLSEINLNELEYAHFETFEGSEIRKNRYFHEFDGRSFAFDVYLGKLWGLNVARVEFDSSDELERFEPPPFAIFEITNDAFFGGDVLVTKNFEEVRAEVTKFGPEIASQNLPDE